MHKLLERQLRRRFGSIDDVPADLAGVLEDIDRAYHEADQDRRLIEHSLEIASRELTERYQELEKREADLRVSNERLKQVDQVRAQFLNAAAHELGTPLTPIRIQLNLVRQQIEASHAEEALHGLMVMDRNVERLRHLVKDLLDAARLQADQMALMCAPMALDEVLHKAIAPWQEQARAAGVGLREDIIRGIRVLIDAPRITQVIDHLVANAIKFTKQGGMVTVRCRRDGVDALVEVEDSGIGIDPAAFSQLFQPFAQVHDPLKEVQPGTGLGLFIAHGLITAHKGTIGVRSEGRGKGATFWFRLPLV